MEDTEKTWSFNTWADDYDRIVASGTQYYARYNEVLDTVAEVASISHGQRVLDIGAGTGNLALRCLARGAVVVGLDPSERMLVRACEKVGNNPQAEFHQVEQPFLCIPYPDSSFDAVVSTYAFHHVPRHLQPDSVREMLRVLRPGGLWALGDVIFEDEQAERRALLEYEWLEEEYFARMDKLRLTFAKLGMELSARQFTPVTWVLWATKSAHSEKRS